MKLFIEFLLELYSKPVYGADKEINLISHPHIAFNQKVAKLSELFLTRENNAHVITLLMDNILYAELWTIKDKKGKLTQLNPVK